MSAWRSSLSALPRAFGRALDRDALANGLLTFLLASRGPLAILLEVATRAGLERAVITSWIFAAFVSSGLLSILFCALYRQPAAMAWSIPGSVLVGAALGHLSLAEVVGAYLVTGAPIVALGLTGWVMGGAGRTGRSADRRRDRRAERPGLRHREPFGRGREPLGALVSFPVTVSGVSIYNIGAPFWGLAFGHAASRLLEARDFAAMKGGTT